MTNTETEVGIVTESKSDIENALRLLCDDKTPVSVLLKDGRRLSGTLERNKANDKANVLYRIWEYEFSADKVKQIWVKM